MRDAAYGWAGDGIDRKAFIAVNTILEASLGSIDTFEVDRPCDRRVHRIRFTGTKAAMTMEIDDDRMVTASSPWQAVLTALNEHA